jgi:hypothetical protein
MPTYPQLMTDLWARAESILTLEHDTVPHEDSLAEMEACPKPWCAYAYAGGGSGGAVDATYAALGCSKITSTLIRATSQCFSTWGTEKDQGNTHDGGGYVTIACPGVPRSVPTSGHIDTIPMCGIGLTAITSRSRNARLPRKKPIAPSPLALWRAQ